MHDMLFVDLPRLQFSLTFWVYNGCGGGAMSSHSFVSEVTHDA